MKLTRFAVAAGITLAAGAASVALAIPAAAYPAGTGPTYSTSTTSPAAGGTVTVTAYNVTPGATANLYLVGYGNGPIGGPVTVPSSGTVSVTGTIPSGVSGQQTLQFRASTGETQNFSIYVVSGGSAGMVSGGGATSGSGSSGSLAYTGAAVAGIGILGVALVAGGVFFVVAGRKRTQKSTI